MMSMHKPNAWVSRQKSEFKVSFQEEQEKTRSTEKKKEKLKLDLNTLFTWNIKGEKCTS